mgnify:CR=1 FL=1
MPGPSSPSHDKAAERARALLDTAVGFAVLGWQRSQVALRELEREHEGRTAADLLGSCAERAGAELRRRLDACAR